MRREPFNVRMQVRVTPQLAAAIEAAVRQSQQSSSELMRQAILTRVRELGVAVGDGAEARAA